ncbi:unnamed protein product, partial [marine sediment metagenome]
QPPVIEYKSETGPPVEASSGAASAFGFTGEQFDAETGFTFLRARYLDPRLGRFLGAGESFIGVFMIALFLVTFTRKMTR